MGTSCNACGTGFLFSHRVLEKAGGWKFFLLTEDVEFTVYNIVHGETIGYCPTAIFYDEQPTSFRQSARQRMRWVQGYLQVLGKYGKDLLKGCFQGRFSCFDILMSIAPAAVITWISILLNGAAAMYQIWHGAGAATLLTSLGQGVFCMCLSIFLVGLITLISEWKSIDCSAGKKIFYLFTFPLFMLTYIPITAAALVCKPEWEPITHNKVVSIEEISYYHQEEKRA